MRMVRRGLKGILVHKEMSFIYVALERGIDAPLMILVLSFFQRAVRLGVRDVRILVRGMGTGRLVCTKSCVVVLLFICKNRNRSITLSVLKSIRVNMV